MGELFRPYLVINVTGFSWEKFELHLTSIYLLELLDADHFLEIRKKVKEQRNGNRKGNGVQIF